MVSVDYFGMEIWQKLLSLKNKFKTTMVLFSVFCTDNKNLSTENLCTILAVYYDSDSSVSFKPTLIDFDLLYNMLALSAVCHCRVCVCCVFVLFSRLKKFRF